jgi:CRISPR-associated endonuclease Cas2
MHYCITYDITNTRVRLRVIKLLKQAGLMRMQKSVFIGISPPYMITDLEQAVKGLLFINDKFCIIPLDKNAWQGLQLLGLNPSKVAFSRAEMVKYY